MSRGLGSGVPTSTVAAISGLNLGSSSNFLSKSTSFNTLKYTTCATGLQQLTRIATRHCSHLLLNTVLLGTHRLPLSIDIFRRANSSKVCCCNIWDRQTDGRTDGQTDRQTPYRFIDPATKWRSAANVSSAVLRSELRGSMQTCC